MDIPTNPYEMTFSFNSHLREIPDQPIQMKNGIDYFKTQLQVGQHNPLTSAKICGMIGTYLRIINELKESEVYLLKAIQLHESLLSHTGVFINEIRLAHTYQWMKKFKRSNTFFTKLIHQAEQHPIYKPYLHYVYQHQGKNLFDQKLYQDALSFFQEALIIREKIGDNHLIESTLYAILRTKTELIRDSLN